ncbi:YciI family protein [Roseiconus lacunae]|uniref:YciI family protein n=1 Tax=Roseiconus lacunae TaxID=2605694 RepID=UPI00308766A0|nr:YciI family protein [Stieleria sp. HD01]
MKFVCLGYIDETKWESMSEEESRQIMEQCLAYDDELRRGGHFIGGEALQSARHSVTLRMKNGAADVIDGPYAETKETLGGILLLEARDLNHAISLMSQHPGVRVGPFEIRPADEEVNALVTARHEAFNQSIEGTDQ